MWCHEGNHFPAVIETCTGHRGRQFDHPTFGSWVSYALGTANKNLPTFVNIGRPSSPVQLTGGYLGARVAATPFQPGETPIPNLKPPKGGTAAERDRQMQALAGAEPRVPRALRHRVRHRGPRRGLRAGRPDAARRAGGRRPLRRAAARPGALRDRRAGRPTTSAGSSCWRVGSSEQGVRFVQVCHAGGGNGGWDAHGDIETHGPLCRATDKPIAGLIRDLKQRGMLDETLVVWTSEFGRSPWSQNTTGRDHNPRGYSAWMAGGGVKGGVVHGATDDVGYKAVESPHYYSDLHATILHQLGLDHAKMEIAVLGRTMRLVEKEETKGPIRAILG